MTDRYKNLPWDEAWELSRMLRIYDGLKSKSRPDYIFIGKDRDYYERALSSPRRTKSMFLPGSYRPIMGGSPATYFIKNSGSDANDGLSDANAWQTVSKIETETFAAGDIIQLNRGDTWNENFRMNSSGAEGSPITIQPYGSGAKPVINGVSPGGTGNATIYMSAETDVIISNLKVTTFAKTNSRGVYFDGSSLRCTAEYLDVVGDDTDGTFGIRFVDSAGGIAQFNDISTVSQGVILTRNVSYTDVWPGYIGHNTVHDATDQNPESGDLIIVSTDGDFTGMLIEHNDVSGWQEDGFDLSLSNGIVQFNTVHDAGVVDGQGKVGIKILNADEGKVTIRYNHLHTIDGVGTFSGTGIVNDGEALIHNNLIHDITVSGSGLGIGISKSNTFDSEIYNNTIVQCADRGMNIASGGAVTLHNNICEGTAVDIRVAGSTVTGGFNCLVNDAAVTVASGSYSGGSDDLGSTDPLFTDSANNVFTLTDGSPCVGAGKEVGITQDFAGDPVPIPPGGVPDIGAYELQTVVAGAPGPTVKTGSGQKSVLDLARDQRFRDDRQREWLEHVQVVETEMWARNREVNRARDKSRTRKVPKISPEFERIANKKEKVVEYEAKIYRKPEEKK